LHKHIPNNYSYSQGCIKTSVDLGRRHKRRLRVYMGVRYGEGVFFISGLEIRILMPFSGPSDDSTKTKFSKVKAVL